MYSRAHLWNSLPLGGQGLRPKDLLWGGHGETWRVTRVISTCMSISPPGKPLKKHGVFSIDLFLCLTRSTNERVTFLNLWTNTMETSVGINDLIIAKYDLISIDLTLYHTSIKMPHITEQGGVLIECLKIIHFSLICSWNPASLPALLSCLIKNVLQARSE